MNSWRSWTGDLLIVDTDDLKTMPPSEIHVTRFKSKEVCGLKRNCKLVFPCRTGETLQERQPLSTAVNNAVERPQARISTQVFRNKQKKPEIHVHMLKLEKISGVLWEITKNIGITLLQQERNSILLWTICDTSELHGCQETNTNKH